MSIRPQRFIEDDPNGIVKLNKTFPTSGGHPPAYALSFDLLNKPISELVELLKEERSMNHYLREAWDQVEEKFKGKDWPGKKRHIPKEIGLAAYAYSIEYPVKIYSEFNEQTRNSTNFLYEPSYHYKSLFALLHKGCTMDQTLQTSKPVLYRGCSLKFGGVTNGDLMTFRSFTSTSKSKTVADQFLQGSSVCTLFEIKDAELGLSMLDLSYYPDEYEFLLLPYDLYRVDDIQQIDNVRKIVLRSMKQSCNWV